MFSRFRGNRSQVESNCDESQVQVFGCVQRTLLCMLMVYSRVTTSAMAERVFLPVLTGADISVVEEIMLGWE